MSSVRASWDPPSGIHPLEAMAAALIGLPLAGVLGAFFAVPIVGFLHVALRHAYREFFVNRGPAPATPIAAVQPGNLPNPEPTRDQSTTARGEQRSTDLTGTLQSGKLEGGARVRDRFSD